MISQKQLVQYADSLGVELLGVVPAGPVNETYFSAWIKRNMHGEMDWLKRSREKRLDPSFVLPNVQSIVLATLNYFQGNIPSSITNDPSRGLIARYAWYPEYHDVLKRKMDLLAHYIQRLAPKPVAFRSYVDTGPILERWWAERAGLGFIGNNSNLIFWKYGSYVFLGELLVDIELPVVRQNSIGSCGTCTRCMQACPTSAIVQPKVVDARACISYLTIEQKGAIPLQFRKALGKRIFGCDICQEACPWNSKAKKIHGLPEPDWDLWAPKLSEAVLLSREEFQRRYSKSPVLRAKHKGFIRNVAVALGNWGSEEAYDALVSAKKRHDDPLIQEHIDWAIAEIGAQQKK